VQRFPEVLQQVKTICHLDGRGRALASPLGIGARSLPGDHLDSRMLLEPGGEGRSGALREERHRLVALQVHQDRAIRVACAQREIVHAQRRGRGKRRDRQPAEPAPQRVPAHCQPPAPAQAPSALSSQGHAEVHATLGGPQRASGPGSGHRGETCGKNAAAAVAIAAEPLADAQLQAHAVLRPRQIGQSPFIGTVDAMRRCRTERTWCGGRCRTHRDGDLCRGVVDVTGGEAQGGGIG